MSKNNKVSRQIPSVVQNALWAVSAGRCEICGKKLYIEEKTNTLINISQKAHIHPFSKNGPRFSMEQENPHEIDNLMLLCLEDHKMIDSFPDTYTVPWLREQKRLFEEKVSSVIDTQRIKSSILYFQSGITKQDTTKDEKAELCPVLLNNGNFFDGQYHRINVEVRGVEHTTDYYQLMCSSIKNQIDQKSYFLQNADCVSVFGLAPQPLLLYFGFLLNDESNIKVYQRSRDGELKWDWKKQELTNHFSVEKLDSSKLVNLNEINIIVSVSAEIDPNRVPKTQTIPTIIIRADRQSHNAIQSVEDAEEFIRVFRTQVIERIRAEFPYITHINIFPAAPVSLPIRMGMNYQKNIDVEWRIFNQETDIGFVYALSIKGGNSIG